MEAHVKLIIKEKLIVNAQEVEPAENVRGNNCVWGIEVTLLLTETF